jgi:hypothetical protein
MSNGGGRSHLAVHQKVSEVTANHAVPREADFGTPNAARIFDYYLGGKDNYAADREAARRVLGTAPDVPLAALENREFLKRVIPFLAWGQGVTQFVDIGPGLPTQGNVHQLARQYAPHAHIAYVDNDAFVVEHGTALLHGLPSVTMACGDLRKPERILSHPDLRELIDFSQPVALLMTLVLELIPPGDNPYDALATFRDALSPKSFLVLSHATDDERKLEALPRISGPHDTAGTQLTMRSYLEITRFFDGFELVDPGVVFLPQWRPTVEHCLRGGAGWRYCGVGKKP